VKTLPPEIEMIIAAAGGVPSPFDGDADYRRFHHLDLRDLHDEELDAERIMVGVARAVLLRRRRQSSDLDWFVDRLSAVLAEIARRQRRAQR
jgi:hypothetical protein